MDIQDLTLRQINEIKALTNNTVSHSDDILVPEPRIVILQRGWAVVGNMTQRGEYIYLTECHVIRTWGTKNGIGELAMSGPLTNTKLDPIPEVRAHILTVVFDSKCEASKWKCVLGK